MDLNRRQFFKVAAVGLGGSSLAALGMAPTPAFAEQVRHFKLAHTKNPQHLPLLLGRLRPDHVQPG